MDNNQINMLAGYLTGIETAVVHIANVVASKNNINKVDLADSFRKTAEKIPDNADNNDMIKKTLRHIADGIDGRVQDHKKPLLTLILGGK